VIGVVMDREVEAYLGVLGVAFAGAAFLTAEPTLAPARLQAMLITARVSMVCTLSRHLSQLEPLLPPGAHLVVLDAAEILAAPDPGPVLSGVRPGDTAYVVFTSGSTGAPKAISIDHEALINLQVAQRQVYRLGSGDRLLQWFSPNFDGWPADLVLALTSGATLVLAPAAAECVGPTLLRTLRESSITSAQLTPSAWQTVDLTDLPGLRLVAAAGEVCTEATIRRLAAPGRRVLNLYGPAEAAVWATWHECHPDQGDPPIGVAIPNKHTYVLDPAGRPVQVGKVGELWIGGIGVGRYLNQPELMRSRFRPDPLAARPGQLMYATGDLCRWRPDGRLDYLGRRDRQVKVRGQRVELEEVERVLAAAPGITHARVHVDDGQLVATVVVAADGRFDEATVRQFLRSRLHSGMVPTAFRVAAAASLSATGKLDLRPGSDGARTQPAPQRPAPVPAGPVLRQRTAMPVASPDARMETRLVWQLAQMFAACLRLPQTAIRAHSDFFTLGGDSLSVAELLTAVEDRYRVALDMSSIVSAPTPERIARAIHERRALQSTPS
jgi:amino acid adenylation domain-containing protein